MKFKYQPPYHEETPRDFRTFRNLNFPARVTPRGPLLEEMTGYHRLYARRKPDKQMDETLTTGCVRRLGEEMGDIDEPIYTGKVYLSSDALRFEREMNGEPRTVRDYYLPYDRTVDSGETSDLVLWYDNIYMERKSHKHVSVEWGKIVARLNWKEIDDETDNV